MSALSLFIAATLQKLSQRLSSTTRLSFSVLTFCFSFFVTSSVGAGCTTGLWQNNYFYYFLRFYCSPTGANICFLFNLHILFGHEVNKTYKINFYLTCNLFVKLLPIKLFCYYYFYASLLPQWGSFSLPSFSFSFLF